MDNYIFDAKHELIYEMMNPILSSLEEKKVKQGIIYQINLVLEELLVNVTKYAYKDKIGKVEISYEIKDNVLDIIIKDQGIPFDPLKKDDPNLNASLEEREIGGLGIFMVKNLVDDIEYQRKDDSNILEIKKNLTLEDK